MTEIRTKSSSSKTSVTLFINDIVKTKLYLICDMEKLTTEQVLEKLIINYTPIFIEVKPGEFRTINMNDIYRLRKMKPGVLVVSIPHTPRPNSITKLSLPFEVYKGFRDGKITWEEYRRQCIERWMLPDAQEEIARLRKLRETQDVYITGFERDEEHSVRRMFVDFVNGKLVWT